MITSSAGISRRASSSARLDHVPDSAARFDAVPLERRDRGGVEAAARPGGCRRRRSIAGREVEGESTMSTTAGPRPRRPATCRPDLTPVPRRRSSRSPGSRRGASRLGGRATLTQGVSVGRADIASFVPGTPATKPACLLTPRAPPDPREGAFDALQEARDGLENHLLSGRQQLLVGEPSGQEPDGRNTVGPSAVPGRSPPPSPRACRPFSIPAATRSGCGFVRSTSAGTSTSRSTSTCSGDRASSP